jgi:hypothetical protein
VTAATQVVPYVVPMPMEESARLGSSAGQTATTVARLAI